MARFLRADIVAIAVAVVLVVIAGVLRWPNDDGYVDIKFDSASVAIVDKDVKTPLIFTVHNYTRSQIRIVGTSWC